MEKVHKRLQVAIEERFPSVLQFQEALPREARGTSYASVRSYVLGERPPPLEFLMAAAAVLGVRLEWLQGGEEEARTESDRAMGEEAGAAWHRASVAAIGDSARRQRQAVLEGQAEIEAAVRELLDAAPLPARWGFQDLVFKVYDRKGPREFGVAWEGEWEGVAALQEHVPIPKEAVQDWIRKRVGDLLLYHPHVTGPHRASAQKTAAWLSTLAALYLRELA